MPVYFPSSGAVAPGYANVSNWNPSVNLTHWRTAKNKVKAGTGNARVLCVGDSTTMGIGTTGSETGTGMVNNSYPAQLAGLLTTGGLTAQWDSFFGMGNGTNSYIQNDSRISSTGVTSFSSYTTMGGDFPKIGTSSGNGISFTPTGQVDTFKTWYATASGNDTITMDIDGAQTTSINTSSGSFGVGSQTLVASGGVGAHTCNLKHSSGTGGSFIMGIEAWNSTVPSVHFLHAGWPGGTANSWANNASNAWGPPVMIPNLTPDLTFISLGINDWANAQSYANYATGLQTLITAAQSTGDVILMSPNPTSTVNGTFTGVSVATQLPYVQIMKGLANLNNIPFFDLWNYLSEWDVANSQSPNLQYDTYHLTTAGYGKIASFLSAPLLAA